jgi:hypothetical protein
MSSRLKFAAGVTVIAAGSLANAAPLTVDFQQLGGGATYTGQGAYTGDGVPSPTWNTISTLGTGTATKASDGSLLATPIGFTSTPDNTTDNGSNSGTGVLLGQEAYISGDSTTDGNFTLTGVPEGTYTLYLYAAVGIYSGSDHPNDATQLSISTSISPVQSEVAYDGTGEDSFTQSITSTQRGNYVVISNVAVGADGIISGNYQQALDFSGGADSRQAFFNGLQLVQTPEPASLGILGLSTLGILARRRRV